MMRQAVVPALLDAAERLFGLHGIHGAGIDAILAASGKSSRSLYQHFGSKEGLARAVLKRRDAALLAMLGSAAAAAPEPEGKLLALFDALETWFRQPDFRGCPFVHAAGAFPDPGHPLRRAAADHKRAMLALLRELVAQAGFVAPVRLARELYLLIEGATAAALVLGEPGAAATAKRAAATLIEMHRRG